MHGSVLPMRELLILAIHVLVTCAKLLRPGGVRAVAAESLLLKHQLLISNRSRQRAPNLTSVDRFVLGLTTLLISPGRIPKLGALGICCRNGQFAEIDRLRRFWPAIDISGRNLAWFTPGAESAWKHGVSELSESGALFWTAARPSRDFTCRHAPSAQLSFAATDPPDLRDPITTLQSVSYNLLGTWPLPVSCIMRFDTDGATKAMGGTLLCLGRN